MDKIYVFNENGIYFEYQERLRLKMDENAILGQKKDFMLSIFVNLISLKNKIIRDAAPICFAGTKKEQIYIDRFDNISKSIDTVCKDTIEFRNNAESFTRNSEILIDGYFVKFLILDGINPYENFIAHTNHIFRSFKISNEFDKARCSKFLEDFEGLKYDIEALP